MKQRKHSEDDVEPEDDEEEFEIAEEKNVENELRRKTNSQIWKEK